VGNLEVAKTHDPNGITGLQGGRDAIKSGIDSFCCGLFGNLRLLRNECDQLCLIHGLVLSIAVLSESLIDFVNAVQAQPESLTTRFIIAEKNAENWQKHDSRYQRVNDVLICPATVHYDDALLVLPPRYMRKFFTTQEQRRE
jgi:hypothetical protein